MGSIPTLPPMGSNSGAYPPPVPQVAYVIKPRTKWQALRVIAKVLKVFAWVVGGLGVLAVLATLTSGSQLGLGSTSTNLLLGVFELLGAGLGFLGLYGGAEVIFLLISIEENTRQL